MATYSMYATYHEGTSYSDPVYWQGTIATRTSGPYTNNDVYGYQNTHKPPGYTYSTYGSSTIGNTLYVDFYFKKDTPATTYYLYGTYHKGESYSSEIYWQGRLASRTSGAYSDSDAYGYRNSHAPSGWTYYDYDTSISGTTKYVDFYFSPPKVTITLTYNANGGSGAPSSDSKSVNQGSSATFSIKNGVPSRSGYEFQGWGSSSTSTTASWVYGDTLTTSSNKTIYAVWKKLNTFTLKYDANGGSGAPSDESRSSTASSYSFTVSSTKPTRTGYTFQGWSTSSTATSPSYYGGNSISVSSTTTLYAVWKLNEYTVTYKSNYTGGPADKTATKYYGTNLTLGNASTFSRSYYTLSSWNTSANGTGTKYSVGGTYSTNAALTLYAQWTAVSYTVTMDKDAGISSTSPASSGTATNAEGLKISAIIKGKQYGSWSNQGNYYQRTNTTYDWKQWSTTSGSGTYYNGAVTNSNTFYPTSNATIKATTNSTNSTEYKYVVTYNSNGGSGSMSNSETAAGSSSTGNKSVSISANGFTPPTGYHFLKWNTKSDGSGTTYYAGTQNITTNLTLYAIWEIDNYTLTVLHKFSETELSRNVYGYDYNTYINPPDFSKTITGYNYFSTDPANAFYLKANTTITIYYTKKTYVITYKSNYTGGAADKTQNKTHGTNVTLYDATNSFTRTYYTLTRWDTNAAGTGTSYNLGATYSTDAALTLYAQWTRITYKLTINWRTNSSIIESKELIISAGETVTPLNYTKDITDYTYDHVDPATAFTMTANATINVYYEYTPDCVLTKVFKTGQEETVFPTETVKFQYGSRINPSDYAKVAPEGYNYDRCSPSAAFNITSDTTITYYYSYIYYKIKYDPNGGTGTISDQSKRHGMAITLSNGVGFSKDGILADHWNTKEDDSGTTYELGGQYTANADVTLYAIWKTFNFNLTRVLENGSRLVDSATESGLEHTFTPIHPADYIVDGKRHVFIGYGDTATTPNTDYDTSITVGKDNYDTIVGNTYNKTVYEVWKIVDYIQPFVWTDKDGNPVSIEPGSMVQNLSATCWNNSFYSKINEVEEQLGRTPTTFATVRRGPKISASVFNSVKNAIASMNGAGSVPGTKANGYSLNASDFNTTRGKAYNAGSSLKAALNRAIDYINTLK